MPAAGVWTLFAYRSPINTLTGTGQLSPLTEASGFSATFSLTDMTSISFSLPGTHWQAGLLQPLITDVIAVRNGLIYQRFRITSSTISRDGGSISVSFSGVSYKDLLDSWIIHDTDTRSFTAVEQTAIAWTIISQGQSKPGGNLKLTRGIMPTTNVNRDRIGSTENGKRKEFYEAGKKRGEAVKELSQVINGFEWDIEPDPLNTNTALKFNVWNEGMRKQFTPRCPMLLDGGGAVYAYSRQVDPTEYAQVVRVNGAELTAENTNTTTPGAVVWRPATKNPSATGPSSLDPGRFELQVGTDLTTTAAVTEAADAALAKALNYLPSWTVTLAAGMWEGKENGWLGDWHKLRIKENVRDEYGRVFDTPLLDVNEDLRAVQFAITYDKGVERVSISLSRQPSSYVKYRADNEARISNLERR